MGTPTKNIRCALLLLSVMYKLQKIGGVKERGRWADKKRPTTGSFIGALGLTVRLGCCNHGYTFFMFVFLPRWKFMCLHDGHWPSQKLDDQNQRRSRGITDGQLSSSNPESSPQSGNSDFFLFKCMLSHARSLQAGRQGGDKYASLYSQPFSFERGWFINSIWCISIQGAGQNTPTTVLTR